MIGRDIRRHIPRWIVSVANLLSEHHITARDLGHIFIAELYLFTVQMIQRTNRAIVILNQLHR
jgi:hypothetical protein